MAVSSLFHIFPHLSAKDFSMHLTCLPGFLMPPPSLWHPVLPAACPLHFPTSHCKRTALPGVRASASQTVSGEGKLVCWLPLIDMTLSHLFIYLSVNKSYSVIYYLSIMERCSVVSFNSSAVNLLASGQNPQLFMFKIMNWGGHAKFMHLNINLCIVYAFKHKCIKR